MGVPHAQIIGTYGERCTSGSNLNGAYGNGNLWDANGALNHGADAHDPQHANLAKFGSVPFEAAIQRVSGLNC